MRKLASIRKVSNIRPIEGKDFIVQVNVDGWNVIVKKDEFQEGDMCVYVEIDSKLPAKPEFSFLEKKKYVIKTMKMSGVRSEGIVFPLSIIPKNKKVKLGDDVTDILGITQYNKEEEVKKTWQQKLMDYLLSFYYFRKIHRKFFKGKKKTTNFPHWIRKTDEERIQNCRSVLEKDVRWVITEKVDGSSATFGYMKNRKEEEYVVCSRNLRVYASDCVWQVISRKHSMETVLKTLYERLGAEVSVVIQGEIINSSIQGNKYKVNEPQFYAFNLVVDGVSRFFPDGFFKEFGIDNVPFFLVGVSVQGKTVDEILELATFQSALNKSTLAEGLVFRSYDELGNLTNSWKAVSPTFLMKNNE